MSGAHRKMGALVILGTAPPPLAMGWIQKRVGPPKPSCTVRHQEGGISSAHLQVRQGRRLLLLRRQRISCRGDDLREPPLTVPGRTFYQAEPSGKTKGH